MIGSSAPPLVQRTGLAVVVIVVMTATVTTARAQDGTVRDPFRQAVDLAIRVTQTQEQLVQVTRQLEATRVSVAALDVAVQTAEQRYTSARRKVDNARERLRQRAIRAYQGHGATESELDGQRIEELARADRYAAAATSVDMAEIERLQAKALQLAVELAQLVESQRQLAAQVQQLTTQYDQLSAYVANAQRALDALGGVPIMGPSRLTAAQLAAWFQSTGQQASLAPGTTMLQLAQMYIEEGVAENVRADLAFAQSVLETASFRETRGNNYSGIGNCDSCGGHGMMFPTPRDGVRTQIQLLRSYADPGSRAANLSYPPDATLFSPDPVQAAVKYDTFSLKGKVPLWNLMGNGNWATSTTYASKVLTTYARMLVFAAAHP